MSKREKLGLALMALPFIIAFAVGYWLGDESTRQALAILGSIMLGSVVFSIGLGMVMGVF